MLDRMPDRPSPLALAAGVRRSGALQAAELKRAGLQRRHDEITERVRALIVDSYGRNDGSTGREIKALETERVALENAMRPLIVSIRGLRLAYAAKVAAALTEPRNAALSQLLAGLDWVRDALQVIDECADGVRNAGGESDFFDPVAYRAAGPTLGCLEAAARRDLGGAS